MHAQVRLDHKLIAVDGEQEVHAMLELAVPDAPEDAARPPLRLALVLDRSGSMAGPKLEVAKRCAAWLVERLSPRDELALVAYDDDVWLLAPLASVRQGDVLGALASLYPGGSTNLSGGWLRAFQELRRADGDAPRKILLLTDGLANVGVTEPERLIAIAGGARREGVGTTTIGFGHDFDEDLLTQMADAGAGNAHYAETPDAAPAIFAEELEGLTRLAAQNVVVECRPGRDAEWLSVLNDYPHWPGEHGVVVELGDAYAGDKRRVVFGLRVPRLRELGVVTIAELIVRYASVGEEIAARELTIPVVANAVSADEARAAVPDAEVREEVLRLDAARAREEAIRLADAGHVEQAQRLVELTASELRVVGLADEADELGALPSLAASYGPAERKSLRYGARRTQQRRR
jgi:Ca-activated chloride channel family protein